MRTNKPTPNAIKNESLLKTVSGLLIVAALTIVGVHILSGSHAATAFGSQAAAKANGL